MNGVGDNEPNLKFLVCFILMFFRLRTCKVTQITGRIRRMHCLETTSKPLAWDCLHIHCFKYYVERSRFWGLHWQMSQTKEQNIQSVISNQVFPYLHRRLSCAFFSLQLGFQPYLTSRDQVYQAADQKGQ